MHQLVKEAPYSRAGRTQLCRGAHDLLQSSERLHFPILLQTFKLDWVFCLQIRLAHVHQTCWRVAFSWHRVSERNRYLVLLFRLQLDR